MTVKQLSIAFIHRLPVILAMPNKPRVKYKEILFIEYSRQKAGNKRVNAGLFDDKSPRSITIARLKYLEPCLNDYSDDGGDTYSYNTSEEDYVNTQPIEINTRIKDAFNNLSPVEIKVPANKIDPEIQKKLIGCVMNDRELNLRFLYIKRVKIYLDHNREPIVYCDFDIGIDIPEKDVKILTRREYYEFYSNQRQKNRAD